MCPIAAPEIETEDAILLLLDFDAVVPCSVTDCDNEAAWWLVCGICSMGRETVCEMHKNIFLFGVQQNPNAVITFNQTCGHTPMIAMCWWEPFKT